MKKEHTVLLLETLILLFCDQLLKNRAEFFFAQKPLVLNSFISFEYTKNTGIAFGIPLTGTLLLIINIIAVIIVMGTLWKIVNFSKKITVVSTALIFAGALGNLIDRVQFGFVRDFISIGPWPTFNLADAYITMGIIVLLIFHKKILSLKKESL
ncbi:signal peptidase II [Candidatus Peregrinibacteria bacterium]|nr:signal peptidase II [Candidatus Peregrinibacteria bacterium]